MVKGLWQRKGIPGSGLGGLKGCMQANVEFGKGVCVQLQHNACAKEENGIFTLSAFSVYDRDQSQATVNSVLVYLDACACMELYREKYMVYSCRTLSVRQLWFITNFCHVLGRRCRMEEQSSCLDWEVHVVFWLGLPLVRSRCSNITDDGSTGLSINFHSSKLSHLHFSHCWSLLSLLLSAMLEVSGTSCCS